MIAVVEARRAAGCRDFVVAADPIEPDRVNVYEEWGARGGASPPRGIVRPRLMKGERVMATNTVRLHRVLRTTPEKLYRAFLDPDAMVKWLPPHGFTGRVHQMEAKVGGSYKMSFTNFGTGQSHSFGGRYLELVPNERIRHTDRFDDPNLPGEMQLTVTFKKVSVGTELDILQEGIPEAIPAEACYLGWQESLALLAQLVEPEIPNEG
jgi:uncharacterized protein YndB with AHSA1/START domain